MRKSNILKLLRFPLKAFLCLLGIFVSLTIVISVRKVSMRSEARSDLTAAVQEVGTKHEVFSNEEKTLLSMKRLSLRGITSYTSTDMKRKKDLRVYKKMSSSESKNRKHKPVILVWTTSKQFLKKPSLLEFEATVECGSCRITRDRSTLNQSVAVVLFNMQEPIDNLDIPNPLYRNSKTYVFWTRETPSKTQRFKASLENPNFDPIFNLTMAYTRNADIRKYFGTFRTALEISRTKNFTGGMNSAILKLKSKLAVWVVSNCYLLSGAADRMRYVKRLVEAGLKLNKFGECFKNRNLSKLTSIVSQYKFYLSFENSLHCPDYITEKFWRNSLEAGLVPVVWGPTKQDLLTVAPPGSFIHVDDFKKPRDLVKYLNYLNKHDEAYMAYHKWRDIPRDLVPLDDYADRGYWNEFCRLCRRLVLEKHLPKMIPSISKWLYETGYPDDKCLRPFTNLTSSEKKALVNF